MSPPREGSACEPCRQEMERARASPGFPGNWKVSLHLGCAVALGVPRLMDPEDIYL